MPAFTDIWRAAADANGLEKYRDDPRFPRLCELLLAANERMNLTAIRDGEGVSLLHFADSLTALPFIPEGARVVDVGCGGGFPCLPLAIARPDLRITALDSTAKKLGFVSDAARLLGLDNIVTLAARAEEVGRDPAYRESFDCATARAVAPLDVLSELCLPLVRKGGRFVALKAGGADAELALASDVIPKLGGGAPDSVRLTLNAPGSGDLLNRVVVTVSKLENTPAAYPRQYSQIKKSHEKKLKSKEQQ